jgi:tetratricopeptide (TPR) repeat protein
MVVAQELSVHGFERQARVFFERLVEWSSETHRVHDSDEEIQLAWYRANALDMLGRPAEGFAELRLLYGDNASNRIAWARLGIAAARAGDRRTADEMSARLTGHHVRHVYGVWTYSRARIAARLCLRDEAIELLREAIFEGFSDYMQLHQDADFRSLWDDPEFQEILRPKG